MKSKANFRQERRHAPSDGLRKKIRGWISSYVEGKLSHYELNDKLRFGKGFKRNLTDWTWNAAVIWSSCPVCKRAPSRRRVKLASVLAVDASRHEIKRKINRRCNLLAKTTEMITKSERQEIAGLRLEIKAFLQQKRLVDFSLIEYMEHRMRRLGANN